MRFGGKCKFSAPLIVKWVKVEGRPSKKVTRPLHENETSAGGRGIGFSYLQSVRWVRVGGRFLKGYLKDSPILRNWRVEGRW
jgi:hypothetical protein